MSNTQKSTVKHSNQSRRIFTRRWMLFAVLIGFAVVSPTLIHRATKAAPPSERTTPDQDVPAYHEGLAKAKLPGVSDPKRFDNPLVRNAYRLAGRVRKILYQQPCYCYCDRHHGHGSLLDCYAGDHASICGVCLKELFYVHEQNSKGESAAQIREGIIGGEWKAVDLEKYKSESSRP